MKSMPNTLKHLNVLIIEEDNMLSSELKYMLKKMGFFDHKIHKASCLATFKSLIKKHPFNVILCHYSVKDKELYKNYLHLYRESDYFLRDCSIVLVSEKLFDSEIAEVEELSPDNILEIPFNFNQFNPLVKDSLIKRKILAVVYHLIEQEQFNDVIEICDLLSEKKSTWRTEIFKTTIECYIERKEYDLAIDLLNDLRVKEPTEWLFVKLIEINTMLENYEDAIEIAHEFEALGFPEHPVISEVTAQQSLLNCDIESAIKNLEKISSLYPNLVSISINLAYLYIASTNYEKALKLFNAIDLDNVINDEQYLCIKESKLYLEVRLNIIKENITSPPDIPVQIENLLNLKFDIADDFNITKSFYSIINSINSQNPIYSDKRLSLLWNNTQLPHRKLILMAIAYYLGFLDLLVDWVISERNQLRHIKNIDDSIKTIIYDAANQLIERKQSQLSFAKDMEQEGNAIDSFVILSKEAPSVMLNHIKLVNSVTQNHPYLYSVDIDSVIFQCRYSISILMKNLLLHNPNHPKIENIKEINRVIPNKFNVLKKDTI